MEEKRAIDGFGAAALIGFAALLAFNQVVVKVTGGGFGPVFQAGLRSVGAIGVLLIWMRLRNLPLGLPRDVFWWGLLSGLIFSYEFLLLFIALDLTTVSRASILFYTMPVWLGLGAHFLLPGERLTKTRVLGMALALCGVVLALADRSQGGGSLLGDVLALAASLGWAAIGLLVRATPLSRVHAETQLLFQLIVSGVVLLALAPLMGDLFRDPQPLHWWGLAFQAVCVASLGFLLWFWLLKIYRANGVASFAFLSPVLAVLFGWVLLGETIGSQVWAALALVAAGIFLINRK